MQKESTSNLKKKRASNRGRDYWLELIATWEKSGESKQAFCKRLDIRPGTFSHWRYIFSKENKEKKLPANTFMEIKVKGLPSESSLPVVPQITVLLPAGVKVLLPLQIGMEQIAAIFHLIGIKYHA